MTNHLTQLLKDSNYKLTQFKQHQIDALEKRITINEAGKRPAPYVGCLVRGKPIHPAIKY
jgi:type I restriction enzyme M protein